MTDLKEVSQEVRETASEAKDKNDFLFKLILRYDTYYGSVNAKSAAIIALQVVVIGTIISNWNSLATFQINSPVLLAILQIVLGCILIFSVYSIWMTGVAVRPFLKSKSSDKQPDSILFFKNVAQTKIEDYLSKIESLNSESLRVDLANQVHVLACGLNNKFKSLDKAVRSILWFQFPLIVIGFGLALSIFIMKGQK